MQGIEAGGAGGQPLAVARELEARIDADAPDIGEVIHVEAGEVAGLLGRAEGAEGGQQMFIERARPPQPRTGARSGGLREERRGRRCESEAGVAALQKPHGRFNRVDVMLARAQENGRSMAERRLAGRGARPLAQHLRHLRPPRGAENSRRNRSIEAISLGHLEAEIARHAGARTPSGTPSRDMAY